MLKYVRKRQRTWRTWLTLSFTGFHVMKSWYSDSTRWNKKSRMSSLTLYEVNKFKLNNGDESLIKHLSSCLSSDSSIDVDVLTSLHSLIHVCQEEIFLLLEVVHGLSIFVKACLNASLFFLSKSVAWLEINTEISTEFVLTCDLCVFGPCLMIFEEGFWDDRWGNFNCSNCLVGIYVVIWTYLPHNYFLLYYL